MQLPPVFAAYEGQVQHIRQHTSNEWSSSCPKCGDQGHTGHGKPDRCRWFLGSKSGKPMGWCRVCGAIFWPDSSTQRLSAEEMEAWRKERVAEEEARKRSAEKALAHLRSERIWEQWAQMDSEGKRHWRVDRGIPNSFQSFWQLGWVSDREFYHAGARFRSDAETIPLFGADGEPRNVKLRLMNADDAGKYRYLMRPTLLGEHPPFLCNPEATLDGHVVLVEGEIKAMCLFARLDDAKAKVLGLPGKTPGQDTLDMVAQADRITLVMDPDARKAAWDLCKKLGKERCWVLIPPNKIDDAIISSDISARELEYLMRNAKPAA